MKFPYTTTFSSVLKPLVSEEKDKFLAMASLMDLKDFLPVMGGSQASMDLLPVAFNACVVNRVNKNGDVIDTPTALAIYKEFINKPINVEHNRQRVIGVILTAGFSEFGTDKPLTAEEVKDRTTPFNITLGGLVWRVVNPELADFIEESNDPTSEHYCGISASWELGFTGYELAMLPGGQKNLADAKIIKDEQEVETLKSNLRANGGEGKYNDQFLYRKPAKDVLPLGIGFTEKPAAEVKGVLTPENNKEAATINEPAKETFKASETENAKKNETQESENKISQSSVSDVKIERQPNMKIQSLKDITDEALKTATAAEVSEVLSAEIKKANEAWLADKTKVDSQLAQANAAAEQARKEAEKAAAELKELKATVEALQAEKAEAAKVAAFNTRMAQVVEAYELDDEARSIVVEEIKSLASDEDFAKWQKKAAVLYKGYAKKKEDPKDKKDGKDDGDADDKKKKDAKAAEEAAAAALENGKEKGSALPNGTSASANSLAEKYKTAFAKENFVIKV